MMTARYVMRVAASAQVAQADRVIGGLETHAVELLEGERVQGSTARYALRLTPPRLRAEAVAARTVEPLRRVAVTPVRDARNREHYQTIDHLAAFDDLACALLARVQLVAVA